MAQPLDIRVVYQPERGFAVIVEGQELNTAGMGNQAILWNVVLYLVQRLPDDGHMDELHMAALQMTEYFQRLPVYNIETPEVERPNPRRQEDLFLHQQMVECPPPSEEEPCCICWDAPPGEQWIKLQLCGHMFHSRCISAWTNLTCPLCRGDLSRNTRRRRE